MDEQLFLMLCHSQCDGTVLHMLCNQARCLIVQFCYFSLSYHEKIGKHVLRVRRETNNVQRHLAWKTKTLTQRQSLTETWSFSTRCLESWKKTAVLKIMNYSRGRTSQLQNCSFSVDLKFKCYISNVFFRVMFLYCFAWKVYKEAKHSWRKVRICAF